MVRGTTPTFVLEIDDKNIDLTQVDNVYATFKQGTCVMTKTGQDIEVSENEVDVYLSQAETLSFSKGTVFVQLNWTFQNGHRACTNIVGVDVGDNLVNGVLQ